jgi:hypothetical protein
MHHHPQQRRCQRQLSLPMNSDDDNDEDAADVWADDYNGLSSDFSGTECSNRSPQAASNTISSSGRECNRKKPGRSV